MPKTSTKPLKAMAFEVQLRRLFKELAVHGIVGKGNFSCCSSCGWHELKQELPVGTPVVFYNQQSAESIRDRRKHRDPLDVYLQWGNLCTDGSNVETGRRIVHVAERMGFPTEWNGTDAKAIRIGPVGTKLWTRET